MNIPPSTTYKSLYYRLIAFWVVCEAFAGGIMHAVKLPFTGMMVSSLSIMCIILIAWHIPSRFAIIRATIVVAIFKLALSPHSPPTAYLAVGFQGFMGHLLFMNKKYFKIKGMFLGCIALAESAAQRILVLWIVYGTGFWKAVDAYIHKITGSVEKENYSAFLAWGYILLHAISGLIAGYLAVAIARKSESWKEDKTLSVSLPGSTGREQTMKVKKRFITRNVFILILVTFLVVSIIFPEYSVVSSAGVVAIIARVFLIMGSWYFILSPIFMKLINRYLHKRSGELQSYINEIKIIIPGIRRIFSASVQASKKQKGVSRLKLFIKILIHNILSASMVKDKL